MSVRLNYHVPAGTQLMTGGRSFFSTRKKVEYTVRKTF